MRVRQRVRELKRHGNRDVDVFGGRACTAWVLHRNTSDEAVAIQKRHVEAARTQFKDRAVRLDDFDTCVEVSLERKLVALDGFAREREAFGGCMRGWRVRHRSERSARLCVDELNGDVALRQKIHEALQVDADNVFFLECVGCVAA